MRKSEIFSFCFDFKAVIAFIQEIAIIRISFIRIFLYLVLSVKDYGSDLGHLRQKQRPQLFRWELTSNNFAHLSGAEDEAKDEKSAAAFVDGIVMHDLVYTNGEPKKAVIDEGN